MPTLLNEPTPSTSLSGPDEGEFVDYRPVSFAAVVAMILAVIGLATAVLTREAWLTFVPVFALSIAIYAVWQTTVHRDRVSGWAPAVFALGLSAAVTGWGVAYGYSRENLRQAQVKEFCEAYFKFLNMKRYNEVHQMYDGRLLNNDRQLNLEELYRGSPDIAKERDDYIRDMPLGLLTRSIDAGRPVQYSLRLMYRDYGMRKGEAYRVVYDVVIPSAIEGEPPRRLPVSLFVEYFKHEIGLEKRWRASQFVEARAEHLQLGGS